MSSPVWVPRRDFCGPPIHTKFGSLSLDEFFLKLNTHTDTQNHKLFDGAGELGNLKKKNTKIHNENFDTKLLAIIKTCHLVT